MLDSFKVEFDDFLRGVAGAFLFGLPLLMTMEVWWLGEHLPTSRAIQIVIIGLLVNLVLAHLIGFRNKKEDDKNAHDFFETITQAFEAMAIGIICAVTILLVLNRIDAGDSLNSILGQIALEAVPLSIGAAVARGLMSGDGRTGNKAQEKNPTRRLLVDVIASGAGALFLAFSVAPTEEVPMLAASLTVWHASLLVGVSLLISYIVVFESGLTSKGSSNVGFFQRPFTETVLAYFISLVVAFGCLILFDQIAFSDPLYTSFLKVLVLGLSASIGAAAGRIILGR